MGTRPTDSRFCSRSAGYSVLYASPDFATAFIETVVRDRFMRRRDRDVALKEITERVWACISARSGSALVLLDLRGDGCARIGAPTDAVHARNHAAGRALAKAILSEHADVEGLLYASRLTGEDIYAVFDRGTEKLVSVGTGRLEDHARGSGTPRNRSDRVGAACDDQAGCSVLRTGAVPATAPGSGARRVSWAAACET